MTPPTHAVKPGVCGLHEGCAEVHPERQVRLYPSGWRCLQPRTKVHHPLIPTPEPIPAEEATHV